MLCVEYSDYMRPLISIIPFLLLISHNLYAVITPGFLANGTEGLNYPTVTFTSDQVRAGDPSVHWRTLNEPSGIKIDNKGKYVGKPTKAGNYSVTVTVSIVQGTRLILKDSISIPHSINSTVAPVINQIALPRAKFDARYQPTAGFRLTATGGVPYTSNSHYPSGYKWEAITDGNEFKRLPAGMNLSSAGVISGIPTSRAPIPASIQTYVFKVKITDLAGKFDIKTFTLTVDPADPPEIVTQCPLPEGLELFTYPNFTLRGTKGKPPYSWSIDPLGNFAPGLRLDNKTGIISGKPTRYGTYNFTLVLRDANGFVVNKTCSINIRPAPEIIVKPIFACARVGGSACDEIEARGGDQPYTWTVTGYPGLTINATSSASKARICGNFTQAGNFTISVTARDRTGRVDIEQFTFRVWPPLSLGDECPLETGVQNSPYQKDLQAGGGKQPFTWALVPPNRGLPPGLTLNSSTGRIAGTPTQSGSFPFAYKVTDSCGNSLTANCSIPINPPLSTPTCNQLCLYDGLALNGGALFSVSGGKPPYTWSQATGLPPNLTLSSNGSLSGTINATGNYTVSANVKDSLGNSNSASCVISVHPRLTITTPSPLPTAFSNSTYSVTINATGGKPCYTWSVNSTSINSQDFSNVAISSISCNSSILTGLPKTVGNYTLNVTGTDACGQSVNQTYTIEVKENAVLSCVKEIWVVVDCGPYPHATNVDHSGCDSTQFIITANGEQIMLSNQNNAGGPTDWVANPGWVLSTFIFPHPEFPHITTWTSGGPRYNRVLISGQQLIDIANKSSGTDIIIAASCNPGTYCSHGNGVGQLRVFTSNTTSGNFSNAVQVYGTLANGFKPNIPVTIPVCSNATINSLSSSQALHEPTLASAVLNMASGNHESFSTVSTSVSSLATQQNPLLQISSFRISNYEITNQQYADFLSAAAQSDPNQLYNPNMANMGIQRSSSGGSQIYSVGSGLEDYPVTFVSWFDAARYANWLANGKPAGPQGPTTTEDGAYKLGSTPTARNAINPNTGAPPIFWLLNESEWYTSAYFKADGSAIWTYPTQSNTAPDSSGAIPSNFANFGGVIGEATPVGFYEQSPGPFGTFDQAGNVREWTETLDTSSGSPMRIIRGGSWADPVDSMRADESHIADPSLEDDKTGFRIGGAP